MERRISIVDLLTNKRWKEALAKVENGEASEASLKPLFFELGFDVNCIPTATGVGSEICWHRPLTGKDQTPIKGLMFYSKERADSQWLKSEWCSFENKCENIEDQSLRQELVNMSREINYHEATVNYMSIEGKKKKRGVKK
jgi:hypothetical protein